VNDLNKKTKQLVADWNTLQRIFIRPEGESCQKTLLKYMEQMFFGLHEFLNKHVGVTEEISLIKLAEDYKDTPGLLLFLLGNENNYGLFWAGAETEDFPDEEDQRREVGEKRGRPMYKLMNDAAVAMKAIDASHPVAICNGDLLFADIIAEECKDVDIYGVNMYRGKSFGDAFERVKNELDKPILFTEFGSDAFNALTNTEDQKMQAFFMVENWKEIYENAYGLGKSGNSIGGFTFQFSDGWWKFGQTKNLDVHDTNASWSNGSVVITPMRPWAKEASV
jgi:hypothetical protein